ncbi:response regulator transcription factor [Mangrovihabitans endophyticus]|uniref:Putative sensory transduction protein n=1 Tax=Mangrovihabitans endophyticus TaxID=1751298 RepID=A0A8J3C2T1_9ACTN|nr:response regulator transcription factor [Mangrovihabitans endophyticus]GGL10422.1 putative sensory transduction protein [Mangrovihabitans endophyticus]
MDVDAAPPAPVRALVVDDEPALVRAVSGYLQREGFTVAAVGDGESALTAARTAAPDVVVLDLMLPGIDGIEVCRRLRTFTDAYVIMLTARADEVDKLIGLSVGADDYLTKPFSPRELVARIRTMLRRPRSAATAGDAAPTGGIRRIGSLTVDPAAREVRIDDRLVDLTRTEFDVLATLAARPRQVFSRRQLIDAVWGTDWIGDEHLVDIHVGHARRKLDDDPADPRYIRTVRGIGYRMGPG